MILTVFITSRITFMVLKLPHNISRYSQLKQLSAKIGHDRVGRTDNQVLYITIIFAFKKVLSSKVLCWIKLHLHVDEKKALA